jgi:hypothetical protein
MFSSENGGASCAAAHPRRRHGKSETSYNGPQAIGMYSTAPVSPS